MKEELIDIIDENERFIKTVPKSEARNNNLLRRGAEILFFNSKGKLLIHRRAAIKAAHPNMWDIRIGGWVISGEEPREAALREAEEEIGAKGIKIKLLFKYRFRNKDTNNDISYLYKSVYDKEIIIDKNEISETEWVDIDNLKSLMGKKEFSPTSEFLFKNYKNKINKTNSWKST